MFEWYAVLSHKEIVAYPNQLKMKWTICLGMVHSKKPSRQPFSRPTRQLIGQSSHLSSRQPSDQPSSFPCSTFFIAITVLLLTLLVNHHQNHPSKVPSMQPTKEPIKGPTSQPSSRLQINHPNNLQPNLVENQGQYWLGSLSSLPHSNHRYDQCDVQQGSQVNNPRNSQLAILLLQQSSQPSRFPSSIRSIN